ncbi:MAG: ATP-binding protein [Bacteroidales bacterium]|nr:ATP-binding protein [Bacteroidales bacterium]
MRTNSIGNPFIISRNIPNEYFCDRKEETELLEKHIGNGRNVVLISPRRLGKTELIHHFFAQKPIADNYHTFFVDIYPASSLQEMCYIFGKSVFERLKSRKERHWESFFRTIKSLRAGFKMDSVTGEPSFELGIASIENPTTTLEEIFSYLEEADRPCIVAFDEFQQIAEFQEKRIEATLRGLIQNCSNTYFIFCGSKQHTIEQMFHSKARPFYQSAQMMDLKPLPLDVYTNFARHLFNDYGKQLEADVVSTIYDEYEGTTWYMQMILNEMFALTSAGQTGTIQMLQQAKHNVINIQEGGYLTQMNMLSPRQKLVLQAIAREEVVKSATSGAFIKKYSLDSASSVQSALRGLKDKEIVSDIGHGVRIYDYFFAWWLKNNY